METMANKIHLAVGVSIAGLICIVLLSLPMPRLFASSGPVDPGDTAPGLWYQYYEIEPDLDSQTPVDSGVAENFDLSLAERGANYALRFSGYLKVPEAGDYTLYVQADSDVRLIFDGVLIMTQVNGDINAPEMERVVPLEAGFYPFILEYVHGEEALAALSVSWSGPSIGKRAIAAEELFYSPSFTAQLPPTATPTATYTVPATGPATGTPGTGTPQPGTPTPVFLPGSRLAHPHYMPVVIGGPGNENSANQPPQITLMAPQNDAAYAADEPITMSASASDDGTIIAVRFYVDGQQVMEDTSAPYSYTWDESTPGLHGIQARAYDDSGAVTSSELVIITVSEAASDAPRVYFIAPEDGDTVNSPVHVEMGADNFTIEPAGAIVDDAGHFHIMIDVPCVAPGETIPMDDNHRHFGNGQTEVDLELTPGEHTLCLQAGNGIHTALDLTDEITITVGETGDNIESDEPRVYFITPEDGDTVNSPLHVEMGADNFTIEPAGAIVEDAGHFHIMIDVPCVAPGETIPMDDNHRHFGNGQSEVDLELAPGEHTLCLQAGNGIHTALDLTEIITVTATVTEDLAGFANLPGLAGIK